MVDRGGTPATVGPTSVRTSRHPRWASFKELAGPADDPAMDPSGAETEPVAPERRRRRLGFVAVPALLLLGLVGLTVSAFVGHGTARVVASTAAAPPPSNLAPPASTSTTATVATTVTLAPSTTAPAPPTTWPTTTPATSPPTSAAPRPTTAVVATASLQVQPSQANFPSTPPPYWPMPIVPVTVTNTGGVAIRYVVVHPVGVYSVPSSTCGTLMPGQSCVAKVQFCPSSPNHYLNTLTVTGEDAVTGSAVHASITLNGTAT